LSKRALGEIGVQWIGAGAEDAGILRDLCAHLTAVFARPARLLASNDRPADSFDPRRGQHSSSRILGWLAAARPPEVVKLLAVTDVDLFIPVLTFVYGEAQLGGQAALVSTARLQDGRGFPRSKVFVSRLQKEATHELGHTFGLVHCSSPGCVMSRSVNLIEVDTKGRTLCDDCRASLPEGNPEEADEHERR
jgi:archaemetzincin